MACNHGCGKNCTNTIENYCNTGGCTGGCHFNCYGGCSGSCSGCSGCGSGCASGCSGCKGDCSSSCAGGCSTTDSILIRAMQFNDVYIAYGWASRRSAGNILSAANDYNFTTETNNMSAGVVIIKQHMNDMARWQVY